jgi:isovaleryl-CoA dehydrogenase
MASLAPRLFTRSIRQTRIRPTPILTTTARYASTKHPKAFTPPSQSDLDELRDSVRDFAQREIPEELAARTDRQNEFPNDMWQKFGEAGFLGITADEEFGGLAMGYQAHCVVMEELSRASGSIGLSYAAHSQLCVNQLMLNGNADQKAKYLPGLISGQSIGALAMSEHSAGSDVVSMKTTAKEVDGGYLLNGTKMWITNVSCLLYLPTYLSTPSAERERKCADAISTGSRRPRHSRLRQNRTQRRFQRHYGFHPRDLDQGLQRRQQTRQTRYARFQHGRTRL